MNETKASENRAYKVTLILVLGLAAFTTAVKELRNLHEMVSSVHEFTRQWRGTDLVTLKEKSVSIQGAVSSRESCPNNTPSLINPSAESDSSDRIAAATDGYVERLDDETIAEPEIGAEVDWIGGKRPNHKVARLARGKVRPARNLKQEISSSRPYSNWPTRFEYKTPDRRVSLELPVTLVTDLKASAFENQVSADFLLSLLGKLDRKQSHDKAEPRRRELMIKRFERGISSRRAS